MRTLMLSFALACLIEAAPAHAVWLEAKSKHFVIYADDEPGQIRQFAERLERFDKAVRIFRNMDDPLLSDAGRLTIFTLKSEDAVSRLVGISAAAGLYESRASGSIAFVPRTAGSKIDDDDLNAEQIFFHEYAHHIQLQSAAALPRWVSEGFAEFFASAIIQPDGAVVIGRYPPYRVSAISYIGISGEQIVSGTHDPINNLEEHVFYGQAWLLTHFFAFEKQRKGQMSRYLAELQAGKSQQDAAKLAFGDLKQLNRELSAYKRGKLISLRLPANSIVISPVAIRPLTAGEAAVMPARIRSARGVDKRTAPRVAAQAREAALKFPGDAAAQTALAEAELDADNYAAAEAAADRAIAVNPNNLQALVFKGRAQMEPARKEPGKADWKAIRSWFSRANRLDPDAAEPLMRFYETFLAAGTTPTPNAVKGLLYAAQLVPQDDSLRLMATVQLLRDKRAADAKQMFAAIAYSPHASDASRALTAKIMAAIIAGDSAGALHLIDEAKAKADAERKRR